MVQVSDRLPNIFRRWETSRTFGKVLNPDVACLWHRKCSHAPRCVTNLFCLAKISNTNIASGLDLYHGKYSVLHETRLTMNYFLH